MIFMYFSIQQVHSKAVKFHVNVSICFTRRYTVVFIWNMKGFFPVDAFIKVFCHIILLIYVTGYDNMHFLCCLLTRVAYYIQYIKVINHCNENVV